MSFFWRPYVPVSARRAAARKEMEKLRKKGKNIHPVELEGRKIAASFWGKGWCDHLESFSDYENRLPRGRTYVRNGSVCHLEINAGQIEAFVSGSELYKVVIKIKTLPPKTWKGIKDKCRGQIGSMLELLQGKLSDNVMTVVCDRKDGLFPQPGEIELKCSCPDWATMCKHVAAVLYGVGNRLDHHPGLLFLLRGVQAEELISAEVALPAAGLAAEDALAGDGLAEIFGIDIESVDTAAPLKPPKRSAKKKPAAKAKTKTAAAPQEAPTLKPARATKKKAAKPVKAKKAALVFDPEAPTGAAIARLRKKAKMPVKDFAEALGVSQVSVHRWENTPGPLRLYARPLKALSKIQDTLQQK
jgi:uncharacterized Zn finger protein